MVTLFVNVDVPDLEEGIRFYTTFGLTLSRRLGPDFAELLGGGVPIYLICQQAGTAPLPGKTAVRDYGRHWTPVHLDFVVSDLEAAVARALGAGAVLEAPVSQHPWGRMALLADPFGNGVCLLELSERGYDAIASG